MLLVGWLEQPGEFKHHPCEVVHLLALGGSETVADNPVGSGGREQDYSQSPVTVMARPAGPPCHQEGPPAKIRPAQAHIPVKEMVRSVKDTISKLNRILPRA